MASWLDFLVLFVTLSVVGAVIYGVLFISKQISQGVASTKESLKSRGLTVSQQGVSIKTTKRFDREDYVDATQRGFVKAFEASSYGSSTHNVSSPGKVQRQDSTSSVKSVSNSEEKKKTMSSMFRRHNSSGSKDKL